MKIRMTNFPNIKIHVSSFFDFKRRKAAVKEPETVDWLKDCLNDYGSNTLLDIGANIGGYSLISCSLCNENKVIAIEPFPPTFLSLCKNISSNNFSSRIFPLNAFFGSNKKGLSLNFDKWQSGIAEHTSNGASSIDICAISSSFISPMLEDASNIIIKIDVDGGEFDVLEALKICLQDHRTKSILIECDYGQIERVTSYFSSLGFVCDEKFEKQNNKQVNLIFHREKN